MNGLRCFANDISAARAAETAQKRKAAEQAAVLAEVDAQLRAGTVPAVTPAEMIGEQVLRALRAGATRVTVDKQEPPMYLLAPPTGCAAAAIMAERPGQVFDFAKGTWVDRTIEGYEANGGSVPGVVVRYLETPPAAKAGEGAIQAGPDGLRVTA